MTETYVLIAPLKRHDITASYGLGPALTPTCAVKQASEGRRATSRHIAAPADVVLAWLCSIDIASRRTSVNRDTFELDAYQAVEFRMRWG
jgi:hypothetical protein